MGWETHPYRLMLSLYSSRHTPYAVTSVHITARRSPVNWDSKQHAYPYFPIQLDGVLGFTVPV